MKPQSDCEGHDKTQHSSRYIPAYGRTTSGSGRGLGPGALCALVCVAAVVAYWPVVNASFLVSYDDELYVTRNQHVLSGPTPVNLAWAFSTFDTGNWHPLTWVSHMLDCRLFGVQPRAHHFVNLAFHLLNIVLLFRLLWWATGAGWKSAFVAALFALHPMHVESVAWVAERKDVLSTMFWLLATLCYIRYAKKPGRVWFAGALACFGLGLMAKPMLVTLPFTLLLLDAWPLDRLGVRKTNPKGKKLNATMKSVWSDYRPLIFEKIPFFALSAVSCILAVIAQSNKNAVVAVSSLSLMERVSNAINSYGMYLWKMVVPVNLACFYPFPSRLPVGSILLSLCVLVAVSVFCLKARRTMPYLLAGWLWYLGTLVPVIGLVQVGVQSMADRYTYVPYIGAFIMIAWGIPAALARWRFSVPVLFASGAAVLAVLAGMTRAEATYWNNSVSLFGRAAGVTKNNDVAYLNLGVALSSQGMTESAIASFNRALAAKPGDAGVAYDVYNNIGIALSRQGKTSDALEYYRKALVTAPELAEAHFNLAAVLAERGKLPEAVESFRQGLRRSQNDFDAHTRLADLLARCGKPSEAIDEYKSALRIRPDAALAMCGLGRLLADAGSLDEAVAWFSKALHLRPDLGVAHVNLGVALAMKGAMKEAAGHFGEAVRINPKNPEAQADLGRALAELKDTATALECYEKAIKLDSVNVEARINYGALLASAGRIEDAERQFRTVLKVEPGNKAAKRDLEVIEKKTER
jgi:tetratricopeptide (TPR) repeat protein